MDIFSHFITGRIVATTQRLTPKQNLVVAFFGFLPDLTQMVLYPLLVWILPRPYYFPANEDWIGVAVRHPWFTFVYEFPHSITFMLLVIVPMILYFRLPKLCVAAYFSHILLDIPTHTGEWATKILCPSQYYYVEGWTDAWAWNPSSFVLCWIGLGLFLLFILYMKGDFLAK